MSQDETHGRPNGDGPPGAAVVQWGGDPPVRERAPADRRRGPFSRRAWWGRLGRFSPRRPLGRLGRHPRLLPVLAGLGAVALFGSLVSEWQVTTFSPELFGDEEERPSPFPAGIGELGAWGGGYLLGLFLLMAATVLLLFGPPATRPSARLTGLSSGGVLLAVLIALYDRLGQGSLAGNWALAVVGTATDQFTVVRGRGIYCALAGVAAVMLATYLAGRDLPATGAPAGGAAPGQPVHAADGTGMGAGDGRGPADDWPWRGPAVQRDDERPPAPLDLTVAPARPFVTPPSDRDTGYDRRHGPTGRSE